LGLFGAWFCACGAGFFFVACMDCLDGYCIGLIFWLGLLGGFGGGCRRFVGLGCMVLGFVEVLQTKNIGWCS